MSLAVQVFGRRSAKPLHARRRPAAEKRQGTKSRREVVRQRCYGLYADFATGRDLNTGRLEAAIRLGRGHNLNVTARILLNREFTFCPIHDFNELGVAEERTRQLLRDELHDKLRTTA
jgi:hypothetical protein